MADETRTTDERAARDVSRRDFVALSLAAGFVAAAGTADAQMPVTETDVTIKTPDGTCDAAFIHPATGSHPAVIIWPDAFGLRPAMRDMASGWPATASRCSSRIRSIARPRRPYRLDTATFSFQNAEDMGKLTG